MGFHIGIKGAVVEAEGLVWPLDTFIDSHGFIRRPDVCECRERFTGEVEVIDERLTLRREPEARTLDWHAIIAIKLKGDAICRDCGIAFEASEAPRMACAVRRNERGEIIPDPTTFVCNSFEAEYCDDCQLYSDWEILMASPIVTILPACCPMIFLDRRREHQETRNVAARD